MPNPPTDRSPILNMPYILPSQAQKHVSHNEALQQLDALVQLIVAGFDATLPPAMPNPGDRYALGSGASGDWVGKDGMIAMWNGAAWLFYQPQTGWHAWSLADNMQRVYNGSGWSVPDINNISSLGINATADTTNRLSVSSTASLLNHDGAGHQLKVNKSGDSDTASLLYQSGFTGHAEMGLAGNNDFSVKVSADGSIWNTAMIVDASSGHITGEAVQSTASDVTPGRLMRADFGYGPGNLIGGVSESGGLPTGAVIERGSTANGDYTRWADGTLMCGAHRAHDATAANIATGGAFRSAILTETFPVSFIQTPIVTLTGSRSSGEWDVWAVLDAATLSDFTFLYLNVGSQGATDRALDYIAVGRWF